MGVPVGVPADAVGGIVTGAELDAAGDRLGVPVDEVDLVGEMERKVVVGTGDTLCV